MPDIYIAENQDKENQQASEKKSENEQNKRKAFFKKNLSRPFAESVNFFTSLSRNPENVSFYEQEEDEKILLFLRKHFITNLTWIFSALILSLFPVLILLFFPTIFEQFNLPSSFIFVFVFFYYLFVFNYLLISFITWFYNVSLVTSNRIVDVDFSDLVYHDVAITKLSLIEDVNYTKTGFIRGLFDFGDVFVQTAGELNHFDFLAIPNPAKVVHIIQDLIGKRREQ